MTKERLEELKMLAEKAIAVKPLEWDEITSPREDGPPEPTGDWEAASIVGAYHVYIFDDHYEVTRVDGEYVESWCSDADEAKAAAQADYSKRILSAIDQSPILALVSELMALREAVKPAQEWSHWAGGRQPVPDATIVDYRLRRDEPGKFGTNTADVLFWHHDGRGDDIIAWRLAAILSENSHV